jgi:ribonuclease P protein component
MKPQSFGKRERIRRRKEFAAVYQQGIRRHSENFTVILCNNRLGIGRLGVTVGKKVGNAVKRNRIKRLLREFFRQNKGKLLPSHDIIIIAKKSLQLPLSYGDVERELAALLIKKADV